VGGTRLGVGRPAVLVLAAALCAGAVYTIVKALGAGESDAASADVLGVTVVLALFGPNALAGLYLAARRRTLAPFGWLTAAVAGLTVVAIAVHILEGDLFLGGDWHLQGVGLALTLAAGQISVLLALDSAGDPPALRLVTFATVAVIFVFGVFAANAAAVHGNPISTKVFAVLATLYLLGGALVLLMRGAVWPEGFGERQAGDDGAT
jgi:hypothetical protein